MYKERCISYQERCILYQERPHTPQWQDRARLLNQDRAQPPPPLKNLAQCQEPAASQTGTTHWQEASHTGRSQRPHTVAAADALLGCASHTLRRAHRVVCLIHRPHTVAGADALLGCASHSAQQTVARASPPLGYSGQSRCASRVHLSGLQHTLHLTHKRWWLSAVPHTAPHKVAIAGVPLTRG